ncbi:tetratricopeptide repeat protein [Crocosphaera sp. XPORK-15E]|uniref:tetratricopeptide repeat protein n=1 Tax=Crocosphaera sp. XPORK-15E TaxID=3110247 RepID=UPI002B207F2D|nr:tetratricopeptide repeat protein [Crocosphaera sp. XPORK-15E]MEA5535236.1 tetratricopeptide repeat protein [Crocosphaera sp. XPORK-15E]
MYLKTTQDLTRNPKYRGLILLSSHRFCPLTYLLYLKILLLTTICLESPLLSQPVNHVSLEIKSNFIAQNYISDPNLNDLLIQGMEKGIQGDYEGAIADFTAVLQINPHEVEAYYNRGIAYGRINNDQAAIADFNRALSLDNEAADIYVERAKIRQKLGDHQGAITDLKTAIELFNKQGNTYGYQEAQKMLKQLQSS